MIRHLALLAALGLSLPATASAQDIDTFQLWGALLANGSTETGSPRLRMWMDVHARRGSGGTVVLVRPGVGVQLTDWLTIWGGYAWIPTFDDASSSASHEHRIWEQATLTHSFDFGVSLQSRTRFEQRFSEAGDDVALRLRQFVRANYRPSPDIPVGIALWDEVFIGLTENDWAAPQGFDQNRVFLGPFLQVDSWARLEAGYLFAFVDRAPVRTFAHVLAINLFVSLQPPPPPPPVPAEAR